MPVVLVVDDDVGIARAVQKVALMRGCEATVVYSVEKALYLRSYRVDLVMLDGTMRGISGLDVLRERGSERRLATPPVLRFSANNGWRDKSLWLGAVEFVLQHEAHKLSALIDQYACSDGPTVAALVEPLSRVACDLSR